MACMSCDLVPNVLQYICVGQMRCMLKFSDMLMRGPAWPQDTDCEITRDIGTSCREEYVAL